MAESTADKKSYKATLNLPKTAFAMKANLVQNEPASMKRWREQDLYRKIRDARKDAPRFVFHDGPPYANGSIHLGHLLNKVLKDIIVRARTMAGFDCPYVPGWDCHGLPIEHKVMQDLGDRARDMTALAIRRKCKADAEKFVKLQSNQMQRLLTLADYDDPYLTMAPAYEGAVLDVFAELVKKGLVYRGLKPVHWSIANRTALAEAELEYYDREDTSVYVMFEVANPAALPADLHAPSGKTVNLMIWTTTPWTLPANMAVAASSANFLYVLYEYKTASGDTQYAIINDNLAEGISGREGVFATVGLPMPRQLGGCSGRDLEIAGVYYRHPFVDRECPVVTAPYVTAEDGTGLVHTAPGHGMEDFQTGQNKGFKFSNDGRRVTVNIGLLSSGGKPDIYCPVRDDGTFDDTVPDWLRGKDVWAANQLVVEHLRASNHLFHDHAFTHSYPHDWRSKTPTIFRATEQWFVSVDLPFHVAGPTSPVNFLRDLALRVTGQDITFIPEWGRNRMRGMLESRPDWCLSRQRAWGLPIPAFYPPEGVEGEALLTVQSVRAVADFIRQRGSDAWFATEAHDILTDYDLTQDNDAPTWLRNLARDKGVQNALQSLRKGSDIFDVWFESGSSWHACMRQRGLAYEDESYFTDLYLEGSDQHRGWFQLSLLPALGATGKPPFQTVLTHGFMVDKDGRKMSKSLGNALEVETLLKDFGADVCRWWVSSLNTDNDIKVDPEFFKVAGEEYRKVRNTIRYLLSNLYDFDPTGTVTDVGTGMPNLHNFKPNNYNYHDTMTDVGERLRNRDNSCPNLNGWILGELVALNKKVKGAYGEFNFRKTHELLFDFCNETLSTIYLAAIKDRLYCDKADAPRRRQAQAAMHQIAHDLCLLLAPILPHTADEAWRALYPNEQSVHLQRFPQDFRGVYSRIAPPENADWPAVIAARDVLLKQIEAFRQSNDEMNPLDLGVRISRECAGVAMLEIDLVDAADLLGVSRVEERKESGPDEILDLRSKPRCARSWKRDGTVKPRRDGGMLCDRCAAALGACDR